MNYLRKRLNALLDEAIELVETEYEDYFGLDELKRLKRHFNGEEE